jgi:hypothetical protein
MSQKIISSVNLPETGEAYDFKEVVVKACEPLKFETFFHSGDVSSGSGILIPTDKAGIFVEIFTHDDPSASCVSVIQKEIDPKKEAEFIYKRLLALSESVEAGTQFSTLIKDSLRRVSTAIEYID